MAFSRNSSAPETMMTVELYQTHTRARGRAAHDRSSPSGTQHSSRPDDYDAPALKDWSTVLASFGATVTFCVCSPSFSCTKAMV